MEISAIHEIFLAHPVVCTDTRKIVPNSLFFALKGEKFNANQFASKAIEAGAAYAIIDEAAFQISDKYILVNDVLETLQMLSSYHRDTLNIPMIAIVGSNGKTTTKELITAVLKQKFNVLATPGNFNNHIGLPLTLLQVNKNHEVAVIEMGANHVGENEFLCKIAKPTMGLVTNNGKDHLEGFGSIEGVAKSNSELYYYLLKSNGIAFVNANDEWLMRMARQLENKVTYAANHHELNTKATYEGYANQLQPNVVFKIANQKEIFFSELSGDYNFDNIMAAVAFGFYLGLTAEQISKGIKEYVPSNNRSQNIKTELNFLLMDAYNANPSSMELAIKNFASMPHEQKVLILGDMFELGNYAKQEHQNIVSLCEKLGFTNVFLCGENFCSTKNQFTSFKSTLELKHYLELNPLKNQHIFIKGSRSMKLEDLVVVL